MINFIFLAFVVVYIGFVAIAIASKKNVKSFHFKIGHFIDLSSEFFKRG